MGRTKRRRKRKELIKSHTNQEVIQLQKWLKLKKIKLKVFDFKDTGRGLKCFDKIEAGEELIRVPLKFLINVDTCCDIRSIMSFAKSSPQLIISAYLLYELHLQESSKFFIYLKLLPQCYTNLFFCTLEEKELLPEIFQILLVQQLTNIKESFRYLLENISDKTCLHCSLPLKNFFSYGKFIWAWFTVNTRAVYYKNEGANSLALAPFLDIFNHSDAADVEVKIEKDEYILKTLKPYKKYDQVFIKYGSHSNCTLLLEYGFTLVDNPNDFVEFTYEEIIQAVTNYNYKYGEIDKFKYTFIGKNNLNKNLTKNAEEFSWNFNGLLYILITKDQDPSILQAKTYSGGLDDGESKIKEEISRQIMLKKKKYFCDILHKLESIKNCTFSFSLAKDLINIYISFLS